VIQVSAYVEQPVEEYHVTSKNSIIVDKDTTNWIDFSAELDAMVKHGEQQELHVSFLDKTCNEYVRIASDAALLEAFSQYWDIRRLPLQVIVHDLEPLEEVLPSTNLETTLIVACVEPSSTPTHKELDLNKPASWGEEHEIEYVGVDDEKEKYKDFKLDDDVMIDPNYIPNSDGEDSDDELSVDDDKGCEMHVHVTDVENPKIEVGVTFEDGLCFKKCIRQYAVLNEVELAVPYSEADRYRAYCKSKKCKWRIHASRLHDGKTWMVCHLKSSFLLSHFSFCTSFSIVLTFSFFSCCTD
jgi:hypothetical protein